MDIFVGTAQHSNGIFQSNGIVEYMVLTFVRIFYDNRFDCFGKEECNS